MAIVTITPNRFKQDILKGVHEETDTYRLALIKNGETGTYNENTISAGTPGTGSPTTSNLGTDEASGQGYTSGGIVLAAPTITLSGNTAIMDFADPSALSNATISANGALIYNETKSNLVVGVYSFTNKPVTSTNGSFAIDLPAAGASTSLVRIS